jgi:hypothetical protein
MNRTAKRDELMALLNALKQRHRDLDTAIDSLEQSGTGDQLQLRRLKKEKLALKTAFRASKTRFCPTSLPERTLASLAIARGATFHIIARFPETRETARVRSWQAHQPKTSPSSWAANPTGRP